MNKITKLFAGIAKFFGQARDESEFIAWYNGRIF
jgi:hypothetical protein